MLTEAIFHQPYNNYAYPVDKNVLFIQVRAKKGDLNKVVVFYDDRYGWFWKENDPKYSEQLEKYASDQLYDYYKAEIKLSCKRFKYFFLVDDGETQLYYSMYGFYDEIPHHLGHFQYTYTCEKDLYRTPDWVKEGIFYEIMVDRFYNGNTENDPEDVKPWDETPEIGSSFGGDLEGIIKKLDYLKELGVTAIYLTPIFKSPSTHKYDVIDYKKIDPNFGDLNTFKELLKQAHEEGIKIVIDLVINHTSDQFFAFKDVLEKGRDSKYKDWYYINEFPVKSYFEVEEEIKKRKEKDQPLPSPNYETFADEHWNMPKLRIANPEVREYFLEIMDYWVEEIGVDGLRFDVSDEIDHYYFEQIRKHIKESNSGVYIIGETFADASPWLKGNELDGITNFRFTYIVTDFFTKEISVNTFENRLAKLRTKYRKTAQLSSWNPIGTHDLTRIATKVNENEELLKLIVAFQMTYIGVPLIYYGDEIGMTGGGIEKRRAPMIWEEDKRDNELFNWYKKLIKIRKENPVLKTGEFKLVSKKTQENIYSFIRKKEENVLFMVFNNSDSSASLEFNLNDIESQKEVFKELITGNYYGIKENKLQLSIPEHSVLIFKPISTKRSSLPSILPC